MEAVIEMFFAVLSFFVVGLGVAIYISMNRRHSPATRAGNTVSVLGWLIRSTFKLISR